MIFTKLQLKIRKEMVYRPSKKQKIVDEVYLDIGHRYDSKKDFIKAFEKAYKKCRKDGLTAQEKKI